MTEEYTLHRCWKRHHSYGDRIRRIYTGKFNICKYEMVYSKVVDSNEIVQHAESIREWQSDVETYGRKHLIMVRYHTKNGSFRTVCDIPSVETEDEGLLAVKTNAEFIAYIAKVRWNNRLYGKSGMVRSSMKKAVYGTAYNTIQSAVPMSYDRSNKPTGNIVTIDSRYCSMARINETFGGNPMHPSDIPLMVSREPVLGPQSVPSVQLQATGRGIRTMLETKELLTRQQGDSDGDIGMPIPPCSNESKYEIAMRHMGPMYCWDTVDNIGMATSQTGTNKLVVSYLDQGSIHDSATSIETTSMVSKRLQTQWPIRVDNIMNEGIATSTSMHEHYTHWNVDEEIVTNKLFKQTVVMVDDCINNCANSINRMWQKQVSTSKSGHKSNKLVWLATLMDKDTIAKHSYDGEGGVLCDGKKVCYASRWPIAAALAKLLVPLHQTFIDMWKHGGKDMSFMSTMLSNGSTTVVELADSAEELGIDTSDLKLYKLDSCDATGLEHNVHIYRAMWGDDSELATLCNRIRKYVIATYCLDIIRLIGANREVVDAGIILYNRMIDAWRLNGERLTSRDINSVSQFIYNVSVHSNCKWNNIDGIVIDMFPNINYIDGIYLDEFKDRFTRSRVAGNIRLDIRPDTPLTCCITGNYDTMKVQHASDKPNDHPDSAYLLCT